MEDIFLIIEELENELMSSKNALFSRKSIVNTEKCLRYIAELKENLPSSLKEASVMIKSKQELMDKAGAEAQQVINEAHTQAREVLNQSTILKRAESESKAIRGEAMLYNDTIKKNAKIYADDLFNDVEKFLIDMITTIRNNREELRGELVKDDK